MQQYYIIPTFEQACKLAESGDFSHSVQNVDGEDIHSFKYCQMGNDIWKAELLGDGRLNMRGLTFDSQGKIITLPPSKFFNIEEISYTKDIDLKTSSFCEKIDGSLISIFLLNGKPDVKTMKNYYSEVSVECRKYIKTRPDIIDFSLKLLKNNISPTFEYVSPTKQIVLHYERSCLYFLLARDMVTGKYFFPQK